MRISCQALTHSACIWLGPDSHPHEVSWPPHPNHRSHDMVTLAPRTSHTQEEEEAMDMVTRVASSMQFYPPQHVLAAEYLHEKYDPKLVSQAVQAVQDAQAVQPSWHVIVQLSLLWSS